MNKTVLITGCSSGFGRALATRFADAGWTVVATLRRARERESVFGGEASRLIVADLDVTDADSRSAVARLVQERLGGRLDCLVNNAGRGVYGALEDLSEEQLRGEMEVNFFGLALLTRELLPALRQARGRVINISSVLGTVGMPLAPIYTASKFAVEGLIESLYFELEPLGVQVALVEPGAFETGFAQNIEWASGESARSPYREMTEAYRRARFEGAKRPAGDEVARAVLSLAERRRMPLRTRCGTDSRLVGFARKLLPEGVFLRLIARVYRRRFFEHKAARGV